MTSRQQSFPDPFTELRSTTLHTIRGANYWSRRPVTQMDVRIGAYEEISSADRPCVTEQLVAALPGLVEHRCSVGTRGGFIQRLRDGTYAAHIIEHVALELQSMIGQEVGYGRTRGTGEIGEYTVAFEHRHEGVGRCAAEFALKTVQHAFAGTLSSVDHAVTTLQSIAKTATPPPISQRVTCGITGGAGRAEIRGELLKLSARVTPNDPVVVDVSPAQLLQDGLPYSYADVAIIMDMDLTDVPERYRDPERAARLVSIVADVVPAQGYIVCPDDTPHIHDIMRTTGQQFVTFTQTDDIQERARRAAHIAAGFLEAGMTARNA